jgi:DNA-binding NarL/FixJ family response regulator
MVLLKGMSLVSHTCARCGAEFQGVQRQYVCPACSKTADGRGRNYDRPLTPRERQVIERLAAGAANKEIAAVLHLTEGTIKEYLYSIFRKVGVTSRLELALWWVQHGRAIAQSEEPQDRERLVA